MDVAKVEINQLLGIGMTFVVLVIALAYGLQVAGDTQDDIGADVCADNTNGFVSYDTATNLCGNGTHTEVPGTASFNSTGDGMTALAKIPAKLPTVATILMAVVIIGLLLRHMLLRSR